MNTPKLPTTAWLITSEATAGSARVNAQFVHVTALSGDTAFYEIRYVNAASEGYQNLPPIKATCNIAALASTRERALAKLAEHLTALESRPPTPHVGQGTSHNAPRGTTETSAAKFPPTT